MDSQESKGVTQTANVESPALIITIGRAVFIFHAKNDGPTRLMTND